MGDAERQVKEKLKSYDVLLITKTTCPFSIRAKKITDGYMKQSASYYVWEINNEVNMSKIQDYIQNLTGARTVRTLVTYMYQIQIRHIYFLKLKKLILYFILHISVNDYELIIHI